MSFLGVTHHEAEENSIRLAMVTLHSTGYTTSVGHQLMKDMPIFTATQENLSKIHRLSVNEMLIQYTILAFGSPPPKGVAVKLSFVELNRLYMPSLIQANLVSYSNYNWKESATRNISKAWMTVVYLSHPNYGVRITSTIFIRTI